MFSFNNIKIRFRILISFGIAIIVCLLIMITSLNSLKVIKNHSDKAYKQTIEAMETMNDIEKTFIEVYATISEIIIENNSEYRTDLHKKYIEYIDKLNIQIKMYEDNISDENKIMLINKFQVKIENFQKSLDKVFSSLQTLKEKEAYDRFNDLKKEVISIDEDINNLSILTKDTTKEVVYKSNEKYIDASNKVIVFSLIGIVVCLVLAYVMDKDIKKNFDKLDKSFKSMIDRKPDLIKKSNSKDEFGEMQNQLYVLADRLIEGRKTIKDTKEYADNFNDKLFTLIENAISINATIDTQRRLILANAKKVNENVENLKNVEEENHLGLSKLQKNINKNHTNAIEIKGKSYRIKENSNIAIASIAKTCGIYVEKEYLISEVNGSIKDVEELTKNLYYILEHIGLIALNASIEAAKAGEFGKGFAVVSDQIRELSNQSAINVESIKSNISRIDSNFKDLHTTGESLIEFIGEELQNKFVEFDEISNLYIDDSTNLSEVSDDFSNILEKLDSSVKQISLSKIDLTEINDGISKNSDKIKASNAEIENIISEFKNLFELQKQVSNKLSDLLK